MGYGDPAEIAAACTNLSILTGNVGRAGGGVAALRGSANYQGAVMMGANPGELPGGGDVESAADRDVFAATWLSKWGEKAKTSNGFVPVRTLPTSRGLDRSALIAAINSGTVKAMVIDGSIAGRDAFVDAELGAALEKLEFLAVIDSYTSPLVELADVVLPKAVALEKDGTFTSFDRTVQRVRAAVPAMGESKPVHEAISLLVGADGLRLAGISRITVDVGNRGIGPVLWWRDLCPAGARRSQRSGNRVFGSGYTDSYGKFRRYGAAIARLRWSIGQESALMFNEVKGFAVTFKRLFAPTITIEYPDEKREMAPRFRGLPSLRSDPESGEALCVACGLCARICPTSCLEMHVIPSEEGDRELGEFILRAGRCMFCGLCSQVCPVDAIAMSGEYELSVMDRDGMVYTKTELATIGANAPIWWESGVDDATPRIR